MTKIAELLQKAKEKMAAMSPKGREEIFAAQRESFVRGMTTPCEHGVLDFEQCDQCRTAIRDAGGGE